MAKKQHALLIVSCLLAAGLTAGAQETGTDAPAEAERPAVPSATADIERPKSASLTSLLEDGYTLMPSGEDTLYLLKGATLYQCKVLSYRTTCYRVE